MKLYWNIATLICLHPVCDWFHRQWKRPWCWDRLKAYGQCIQVSAGSDEVFLSLSENTSLVLECESRVQHQSSLFHQNWYPRFMFKADHPLLLIGTYVLISLDILMFLSLRYAFNSQMVGLLNHVFWFNESRSWRVHSFLCFLVYRKYSPVANMCCFWIHALQLWEKKWLV